MMEEIEEIRERMREELKEGDLVEIALKDSAKFVPGRFPAILLDPMQRNKNQYCVGYVSDHIGEDMIFLRTSTIPEVDEGFDVFYSAMKGYVKLQKVSEEEPSAH